MKKKEINSSRMPVYRDAGFELYDAGTMADAFNGETEPERDPGMYIYSRYRNPTVVAAEEEIMKLEDSSWALLVQSGMAAIDIAVSIFQSGINQRPWLFFSEIYGGTISFTETILKKKRGLDIRSFTPEGEKYDLTAFEPVVKSVKPEFIYIEAISNPMLIVPDASRIIRIAKENGAKVLVDNTFATPCLWKPLKGGADIVIHSATKYFSGHGNLTGGVLCGDDPGILKAALEYRKFVGHMMSADDAYRLHTQVQTFELRFRRQCQNAAEIASLLDSSNQVEKVWYPGLSNHLTHKEASMLFGDRGFGGMVTFDLKGKTRDEKKMRRDSFIKNVSEKIKVIPSLGDPKSILMPVESVWGAKYPEPGMIRLSCGFEKTEELVVTIRKALDQIV
jgi:cystathionine beta-lyase/cystathionine gamma-synthase